MQLGMLGGGGGVWNLIETIEAEWRIYASID